MRAHRRRVALFLSLPLLALQGLPAAGRAQVQASPLGSVKQNISGTEIEIDYYRPSLRGRDELWGGQIYWGEVWTPGANWATTLRVSNAVTLGGVDLPAGKYSLWIEVLETGPWTLVVHPDTMRGHGNHPEVDEGVIAVTVDRSESPRFIETLSFDIQNVRPMGATIEMTWGNTLLSVDLGVDLGFEITVTDEVAAALAGEWSYDDSGDGPSPEQIEEWLADPELSENFRRYLERMQNLERPRPIRFLHDPETGYLTLDDPAQDALMTDPDEDSDAEDDARDSGSILLPRGEFAFMIGYVWNGELASYYPESARIVEFGLDDDGRPVSFVIRNRDDEVIATGERGGSRSVGLPG